MSGGGGGWTIEPSSFGTFGDDGDRRIDRQDDDDENDVGGAWAATADDDFFGVGGGGGRPPSAPPQAPAPIDAAGAAGGGGHGGTAGRSDSFRARAMVDYVYSPFGQGASQSLIRDYDDGGSDGGGGSSSSAGGGALAAAAPSPFLYDEADVAAATDGRPGLGGGGDNGGSGGLTDRGAVAGGPRGFESRRFLLPPAPAPSSSAAAQAVVAPGWSPPKDFGDRKRAAVAVAAPAAPPAVSPPPLTRHHHRDNFADAAPPAPLPPPVQTGGGPPPPLLGTPSPVHDGHVRHVVEESPPLRGWEEEYPDRSEADFDGGDINETSFGTLPSPGGPTVDAVNTSHASYDTSVANGFLFDNLYGSGGGGGKASADADANAGSAPSAPIRGHGNGGGDRRRGSMNNGVGGDDGTAASASGTGTGTVDGDGGGSSSLGGDDAARGTRRGSESSGSLLPPLSRETPSLHVLFGGGGGGGGGGKNRSPGSGRVLPVEGGPALLQVREEGGCSGRCRPAGGWSRRTMALAVAATVLVLAGAAALAIAVPKLLARGDSRDSNSAGISSSSSSQNDVVGLGGGEDDDGDDFILPWPSSSPTAKPPSDSVVLSSWEQGEGFNVTTTTPTTSAPTTEAPASSSSPSPTVGTTSTTATEAPTTAAPSTAAPSTQNPTVGPTAAATTMSPTTPSPTTSPPTQSDNVTLSPAPTTTSPVAAPPPDATAAGNDGADGADPLSPIVFWTVGDYPYQPWEKDKIKTDLHPESLAVISPHYSADPNDSAAAGGGASASAAAAAPADVDATFVVHVGDVNKAAFSNCSESWFREVSEIFLQSTVRDDLPVFFIPGDNDVNDCPPDADGRHHFYKYFVPPRYYGFVGEAPNPPPPVADGEDEFGGGGTSGSIIDALMSPRVGSSFEESVPPYVGYFEDNWSHGLDVVRQADVDRDENFSFRIGPVLFMGLKVMGFPSKFERNLQMGQNLDFAAGRIGEARGASADGLATLVVFAHQRPGRNTYRILTDGLRDMLNGTDVDVLWIHGNGHNFECRLEEYVPDLVDGGTPFPNMVRVQVDRNKDYPPLRVTVHRDPEVVARLGTPFVFERREVDEGWGKGEEGVADNSCLTYDGRCECLQYRAGR